MNGVRDPTPPPATRLSKPLATPVATPRHPSLHRRETPSHLRPADAAAKLPPAPPTSRSPPAPACRRPRASTGPRGRRTAPSRSETAPHAPGRCSSRPGSTGPTIQTVRTSHHAGRRTVPQSLRYLAADSDRVAPRPSHCARPAQRPSGPPAIAAPRACPAAAS